MSVGSELPDEPELAGEPAFADDSLSADDDGALGRAALGAVEPPAGGELALCGAGTDDVGVLGVAGAERLGILVSWGADRPNKRRSQLSMDG